MLEQEKKLLMHVLYSSTSTVSHSQVKLLIPTFTAFITLLDAGHTATRLYLVLPGKKLRWMPAGYGQMNSSIGPERSSFDVR